MTVGNVSLVSAPSLDFKSFITEESGAQDPETRTMPAFHSPFISVYELAG